MGKFVYEGISDKYGCRGVVHTHFMPVYMKRNDRLLAFVRYYRGGESIRFLLSLDVESQQPATNHYDGRLYAIYTMQYSSSCIASWYLPDIMA